MFTKEEPISLTNIGEGAAIELFEHAHRKVLKNIRDINTDPTATRQVKLTFKYKPDSDRRIITMSVEVDSKLVPNRAFETTVMVGGSGDGVDAHELKEEQLMFPGFEDTELPEGSKTFKTHKEE